MTVTRLSEEQIQAHLAQLEGWERQGGEIQRKLQFAHFVEAFGFLTQVAMLAERADHHPEIWNVYNQVTLKLTTHDADNGLTQKDFSLARAINEVLQGA